MLDGPHLPDSPANAPSDRHSPDLTLMPDRRRQMCQAVTETKWRHQQHWIKLCENHAQAVVEGVHLCGSHINKRGDLRVVVTLAEPD